MVDTRRSESRCPTPNVHCSPSTGLSHHAEEEEEEEDEEEVRKCQLSHRKPSLVFTLIWSVRQSTHPHPHHHLEINKLPSPPPPTQRQRYFPFAAAVTTAASGEEVDQLIVGGETADIRDFPNQCSFQVTFNGLWYFLCLRRRGLQ